MKGSVCERTVAQKEDWKFVSHLFLYISTSDCVTESALGRFVSHSYGNGMPGSSIADRLTQLVNLLGDTLVHLYSVE